MLRFTLLLLSIFLVYGCDEFRDDDGRERDRSFHEEAERLSGRQAIDCGIAVLDFSPDVYECFVEAFYLYQPFYGGYYYQMAFGSIRTFAYDGVSLFIIDRDGMDCLLDVDVHCDHVYTVGECENPEIFLGQEDRRNEFYPFSCDEVRFFAVGGMAIIAGKYGRWMDKIY